jgi:hypothetical protein
LVGVLSPVALTAATTNSTTENRIGTATSAATAADVLSAVAALGMGLRSLGVDCDLAGATAAVLEG